MNVRYILLSLILLIVLNGCDTAWDNYFGEEGQNEENGSELNLIKYLETQASYADFVALLKKSGVDKELEKNQILTVWALPDNCIPPEMKTADSTTLRHFILNHVNNVALYKSKLDGTRKIHTLAGKLLNTEKTDNIFYIDGVAVTRMNQICKNGVIHELKGALLPKQNIYEYLMSCGDEFSTFRDTLNAYNDTVFRPELSLPIGINEWGNTVYDSVFEIENPFFRAGDLRYEEKDYTLFLPTNDVIKRMMLSVSNFFATVGREFTITDTTQIMSWLLKSSMHSGKITNYAGSVSRYSIYGNEWRTDKQYVKEDYESCSNGNVFIATTIVFPRKMYMEKVDLRPYYIFYMPEAEQRNYFWKSDKITSAVPSVVQEPHEILYVNCEQDKGAWITFSSVVKDVFGYLKEVKVMPGTYRLSTSFRSYGCGNIDLYVVYEDGGKDKEEKILTFNAGQGATGNAKANEKRGKYEYVPLEHAGMKNVPNDSNGLLSEKFEVKAEWGYTRLRFKLVNAGAKDRMTIQYFLLDPTDDNY